MINQPFFIILFLLALESSILYLSGHPRFKKYFQFLPSIFWIYFLPMLASTFGILDSKSPLYQTLSTYVLPVSIFLLLLPVDIKAIFKLGKPALIMFFAGSLGVVLGTPLVFFLLKNQIGERMWQGFACLAASWTGGSANFIAVKEAMGVPDAILLPMVVMDTIVPYVWMGTLVACVKLQPVFDRWNQSNRRILDELGQRASSDVSATNAKIHWGKVVLIVAFAVIIGQVSDFLAGFLPEVKNIISKYAWTIILVSFFGMGLSFTRIKNCHEFGSTKIGYFLLYFVLTSIGARANLAYAGSTLILIAAGFLIVLIHMAVLLITARIIKAPMFLVATASQANIGGVASAPIVAEIYQPGLASVGLLLAILGNILGTYLGILTGQLCYAFVPH